MIPYQHARVERSDHSAWSESCVGSRPMDPPSRRGRAFPVGQSHQFPAGRFLLSFRFGNADILIWPTWAADRCLSRSTAHCSNDPSAEATTCTIELCKLLTNNKTEEKLYIWRYRSPWPEQGTPQKTQHTRSCFPLDLTNKKVVTTL